MSGLINWFHKSTHCTECDRVLVTTPYHFKCVFNGRVSNVRLCAACSRQLATIMHAVVAEMPEKQADNDG